MKSVYPQKIETYEIQNLRHQKFGVENIQDIIYNINSETKKVFEAKSGDTNHGPHVVHHVTPLGVLGTSHEGTG